MILIIMNSSVTDSRDANIVGKDLLLRMNHECLNVLENAIQKAIVACSTYDAGNDYSFTL